MSQQVSTLIAKETCRRRSTPTWSKRSCSKAFAEESVLYKLPPGSATTSQGCQRQTSRPTRSIKGSRGGPPSWTTTRYELPAKIPSTVTTKPRTATNEATRASNAAIPPVPQPNKKLKPASACVVPKPKDVVRPNSVAKTAVISMR